MNTAQAPATAQADRLTSMPNFDGWLNAAAVPSMASSAQLHSAISAELTEATSCGFTACTQAHRILPMSNTRYHMQAAIFKRWQHDGSGAKQRRGANRHALSPAPAFQTRKGQQ